MVLYFTGTGNSRHIAERIAHALNDTLISLNDRIKSGDITPLAVNGRLVLVMPTYAWRIPRIVRDHLLRTELRGARETWFVMDCGSEIGNAAKYNRALCREKGLVYMGTAQIVMPENFIAMFNAPTVEEARRIVAKAEPFIDRAIAAIRAGHMFSPPRKKLYDRIASSAVNPVFYPLFVKANPFTASDVCIGCGKCEKLCPLNNITLQNARPVWEPTAHSAWPASAIARQEPSNMARKAPASRATILKNCKIVSLYRGSASRVRLLQKFFSFDMVFPYRQKPRAFSKMSSLCRAFRSAAIPHKTYQKPRA